MGTMDIPACLGSVLAGNVSKPINGAKSAWFAQFKNHALPQGRPEVEPGRAGARDADEDLPIGDTVKTCQWTKIGSVFLMTTVMKAKLKGR